VESVVIKKLGEHKEGLSSWDLWKELGGRDSEFTRENIYYHLKKLHEKDLIDKDGSKFKLKGPVASCDGVLLFSNPPTVMNCPYYEKCRIEECLGDGCKLYEESPEEFRMYIKALIDSEG